jgi:hypothetical protein
MQTVLLKSFDNYITANIILSRLQTEGIACVLRDEHTSTMMPYLGNAIGGIKLDVAVEDAGKALELLKIFDEEYLQSAECPDCHAHKIILVPKKDAGNMVTAILTWFFSNYAVAAKNVYHCQQCGYESDTLPESTFQYN